MATKRGLTFGGTALAVVSTICLALATAIPASITSTSIVGSAASGDCQAIGTFFSCQVPTSRVGIIVVFLGCLSGGVNACNRPLLDVTDSEDDNFTLIATAEASCNNGGDTCVEAAFWARTVITGIDTVRFYSTKPAHLAGDVYDVVGVDPTQITESFGASPYGNVPGVHGFSSHPMGFTAAGVVLGGGGPIGAGANYSLIDQQPKAGVAGDRQASEYSFRLTVSTTTSSFTYPSANTGWAEVSISFAPLSYGVSAYTIPSLAPTLANTSSPGTTTPSAGTGTSSLGGILLAYLPLVLLLLILLGVLIGHRQHVATKKETRPTKGGSLAWRRIESKCVVSESAHCRA